MLRRISLLFPLLIASVFGQTPLFQSLTYYQDDTLTLQLDFFAPADVQGEHPLVMYVHGGGFGTGERSEGHDLGVYLSQRGVAVASISYTLSQKRDGFGCDVPLATKIKAIQLAANQLWLATGYFLTRADSLQIDPGRIFAAGTSAGAETVLHAAFWDRQLMSMYPDTLSAEFQYAGLIAGAGAIMDLNLITSENQLPVMMFHGTADDLVPYGTAAHHICPPNAPGWLMLFGSHSIYQHLCNLGGHTHLLTYCAAGHEVAGQHFHDMIEPVWTFLQEVLTQRPAQVQRYVSGEGGGSCP